MIYLPLLAEDRILATGFSKGFSMNEQKKDDLTDDEVMDLEIGMGPF